MKQLHELIESSGLETQLELEDIPDIDLYMDQVIQLFERKFSDTKRYEDEKILTKTMINNYAKGRLFYPIKNKQYTKNHIILISLIYHLKGTLMIKDIKSLLEPLNKQVVEDKFPLEKFYDQHGLLLKQHIKQVKENMLHLSDSVSDVVDEIEGIESTYIEQLQVVLLFSEISQAYRRVAEKLVDEINATFNEHE
ncbi:MAG TPA: DUF1836 domain-containing protein [Cerasibacillus sp.]|uniref:DUF1836 domain-containing protein n=1 Tax=Cerasibacillus sp. TaxID=2498711 RepID=UPI002F418CC9